MEKWQSKYGNGETMNHLILSCLVLCSIISLRLESLVIETHRVEDILPFIDNETWLLVDLDNCFFQASQALGHANWFYDEVEKRIRNGMSKEEAIGDAYPDWIRTQRICKVKPLDDKFIPILKELQQKGVVIMGLTHRQPIVADSTIGQIHSLNFDFVTTAPSKESFQVIKRTPTLYFEGVLFVGDYNKKIDIFQHFLVLLDKRPKKVVFLDDKRKNVDELIELEKSGIQYTGVHYTAINHDEPIYVPEIAAFQYQFLEKILSNEAALLLMENGLE